MADQQGDLLCNLTETASWSILYCATCQPATLPATITKHNVYAWAKTATCPQCAKSWSWCSSCTKVYKRYSEESQLYNHNYKKHKKNKFNGNDNNTENNNGPCLEGGVEDMLNEASPRLPNFKFNGGHNVNYFKNQAAGNLGSAYLVGQSHFRLDNVAADMNLKEVDLHINIATLVSRITRVDRDLLAIILKQVTADV